MTIKQARKLLGKLAENIPDEQLEKELEVAEFLKTLYFSILPGDNNPNGRKT